MKAEESGKVPDAAGTLGLPRPGTVPFVIPLVNAVLPRWLAAAVAPRPEPEAPVPDNIERSPHKLSDEGVAEEGERYCSGGC